MQMFDKVKNAARSGVNDGKALGASFAAKAMMGQVEEAMKEPGRYDESLGGGSLMADTRAQGANGAVNLVVALVVGGLMAAFLLPIVIDELATVDTTSWSDGAAALWGILPVMIVLAVFLFFVGVALARSGRL